MLDLFRKRGLSTIVYGFIIVGMILVFVIQFNPSAGKKAASLKEACDAQVYGWCIDPKDHMAAFRLLVRRDETMDATQIAMNKKLALDGLVERELLVHEAERLGITVTDDEVSDQILDGHIHVSTPSDEPQRSATLGVMEGMKFTTFNDPKTKSFDVKVYERSIRNATGRSPTEFREEQGREILAAKVRDLVRAPVRVSEIEAFEKYVAEKSQAKLTYVRVNKAFVERYLVNATDAQIAEWLKDKANQSTVDAAVEAHKKDSLPIAGHIRHILIKFGQGSGDDKASALAKISEANARLQAGEAFSDVARAMSQDSSAPKGGDVGDKTDAFVAEFKAAADALKPGQTTNEAIETQFGYHLIERDDPAKTADVEAAMKRDAAREAFVKAKTSDATKALAEKIAAEIRGGKSADDAAKDAIASIGNAGAVAIMQARARVEEKKDDADAGASSSIAEANAIDAAAPSSAKKPKQGATKDKAPAANVEMITATTDPDRPQAETTSEFNAGGEPIEGVSGESSLKIANFAFNAKDGDVMPELSRSEKGFIVVQLKEHNKATKEQYEKDKDTYLQGLLALKQAEALAVYVKRLREEHKNDIKIDATSYESKGRDGGPATTPGEMDEEPQN